VRRVAQRKRGHRADGQCGSHKTTIRPPSAQPQICTSISLGWNLEMKL
jgi:hypothetical protein